MITDWESPAVAHPGPPPLQPVGDGRHDDTDALQALLDTGRTLVRFPTPAAFFPISRTLKIHSNQTLVLDRHAVVRLRDGAGQIMLSNDDHEGGNENISVIGGIWDMNNLNQPLHSFDWRGTVYHPDTYLGVGMRFNNVKNLALRGLTIKDPESYGVQMGNLRQFTVEDITFDYNMQRKNMDGIHIHGNSRWGHLTNLKGTTNDDLVALNADDAGLYEMCRGPIEDISVDTIMAEDGWTAVRLLSSGSPVRRIQLRNIFGTYRYNVVSFTNFDCHPGAPSTFEDISIRGVFTSKSVAGLDYDAAKPGWNGHAPIWIAAGSQAGTITIDDYHRTEETWAAENIAIEEGATIESLTVTNSSLINRTPGPIDFLTNRGRIENLSLDHIHHRAEKGSPAGVLLRNEGHVGSTGRGRP